MGYEFWLRLAEEYEFLHVDRLLAADRNHADRKMLTKRENLVPERRSVQREYGQMFGVAYRVGRMCDKLYSAWNRLRGVATFPDVIRRQDLAFPLHVDDCRSFVRRQLFANNRTLI